MKFDHSCWGFGDFVACLWVLRVQVRSKPTSKFWFQCSLKEFKSCLFTCLLQLHSQDCWMATGYKWTTWWVLTIFLTMQSFQRISSTWCHSNWFLMTFMFPWRKSQGCDDCFPSFRVSQVFCVEFFHPLFLKFSTFIHFSSAYVEIDWFIYY